MNRNSSFINNVLYLILLFFLFFPYVSFFDFGTDSQPYAFFFAFVLFCLSGMRFNKSQIFILIILIWSLIVLVFSGINFTSIRSSYNYASLFFISYSTYYLLKFRSGYFEIFFKTSIIVWFLIGLIQTLYNRNFLTFLVASSRTTDDRGVTGLAPEATFYGIVFIFYILLLLHSNFKQKFIYIFLCCIGVVFLAKSSMAFLFLIILFFLYVVIFLNIKFILFSAIFLIFIIPYFYFRFLDGSRLSNLINIFIDNPSSLILIDASINDRFFHMFFSFKGFLDDFALPHGYLYWNEYLIKELPKYSNFVIIESFSINGRIMSGYGSAFFELGFIAFLIPVTLFKLLYSLYYDDKRKFLFYFIFINLIMLSAIQIGFTFFALYIAYLGYLNNIKNDKIIYEY